LDVVAGRVLPLEPDGDKVYPVSSRLSKIRATFNGKALPWLIGSGNNFALKKEIFAKIGGCDERLGPGAPGQGGMDMDLFYRLLRAGARVRYEPDILVYHERQTKKGRLSRRALYGHGMGASFVFWLRQGDLFAFYILGCWLLFRVRLLLRGVMQRHWMNVYEEWLMLVGTVRGVQFAFRHRESGM
jgi:GT2 family glycosyltransferase